MASVVIDKPGQLTTVQDLGRPALRRAGFPTGGAVDRVALRVANLLVGNADDAAALECALVGPIFHFPDDATVAMAGARAAGVPHRQRFRVRAGERLNLSRLVEGAYAYIAIAGGLDVPDVLGSRSTDVRLGFGGHHGRALRAGDAVSIRVARRDPDVDAAAGLRRGDFSRHATVHNGRFTTTTTDPYETPLRLGPRVSDLHDRSPDAPIRVLDGLDSARTTSDWTTSPFTVSSMSDRVGVRLSGAQIAIQSDPNAASGPVFPGTVQLPPDGVPIALLADAQTLGGYPQVGHVIGVDLPRVAQLRPGQAVRFERVDLAEAHRLARRQARAFAFLRYGLRVTMPSGADDRP